MEKPYINLHVLFLLVYATSGACPMTRFGISSVKTGCRLLLFLSGLAKPLL